MERPVVQVLHGERLHLSHGPIDVVTRAWGAPEAVRAAYAAAIWRFNTTLGELVAELAELRRPIAEGPRVEGPIARRMVAAVTPFADEFVTPMAAVAGAVADELLAVMREAADLDKAYVNDGGDIALHLAPGERLAIGLAADFAAGTVPALNGSAVLDAASGIGGLATSGWRGRSFSLGIADSVTVLAANAAAADAAATLIANRVAVESSAVVRAPARTLDPDSDLGDRPVVTHVGALTAHEVATALARGRAQAERYRQRGLLLGATLLLRGSVATSGELPAQRRWAALEGIEQGASVKSSAISP